MEQSEGWSGWVTCLERLKRESSWHCIFKPLLTIMGKKRRKKKKTQISRVPLHLSLIFQWKKPGLLSFCKLFLQRVQVSINNCSKLKGKKTKIPFSASRAVTKIQWLCTNTRRHLCKKLSCGSKSHSLIIVIKNADNGGKTTANNPQSIAQCPAAAFGVCWWQWQLP